METEFIYWKHPTPVGIRVEEVTGHEQNSGKIWREMALQIYCENGSDGYREMGHFSNGAPFLFGSTMRISVTHTDHIYAVASLPKTPESDLAHFSLRTALGIDAERHDRQQVLKIRDKFLSENEKLLVAEDDVEANVIAWTCKEALYKAALCEGMDFRKDIIITRMPEMDCQMNLPGANPPVLGEARLVRRMVDADTGIAKEEEVEMEMYCYQSEEYCITLAYSPKCAKYSRR